MSSRIAFIFLLALAIFVSCDNSQEAATPEAELRVFYLDADGNEVLMTDGVTAAPDAGFVFRSNGFGESMILWPGDRVIDFTGAAFEFRDGSLDQMRSFGVPDSIVDAFSVLAGQSFGRELDLVRTIRRENLFDIDDYFDNSDVIREAIFRPVTDVNGMDSLRFEYNHNYQDFLTEEENGYYGVSGLVMKRTEDGSFELTKSSYPRTGTFEVTLVAVTIGQNGRQRKEDIVTQTIQIEN